MSEQRRERQKDALLKGSKTLLKSEDLLFKMPDKQIQYLWSKIHKHVNEDDNGFPHRPSRTCWRLPALDKSGAEYTRKHSESMKSRGPYLKADYSFTGQYAQTTFTRKENAQLDLADEDFPSTRTFQATHLALVSAGHRPPSDCWQLHNASHLCGQSDCVRPQHLVWEMLDINFSRRMCHVYGAFEECPHEPKCILRAPFKHYLTITEEQDQGPKAGLSSP